MEETLKNQTGSCFDMAELLERVENDRELLRTLLDIFKEDFPGHLQALRDAAREGDMKRLCVVSHTLKGIFSNLAANRATAAAAQLEQLARANRSADIPTAVQLLENEIAELLPKLEICTSDAST